MSLSKDIETSYANIRLYKSYEGVIYTFDLDKTYLATNFQQITKLIKIRFEKAYDKENIPGTAALARELKKMAAPLFFISGSPKSMEPVIRQKFILDSVKIDGLLLRDYAEHIKKLQFKNIIHKIGFKLAALLYARIHFPNNTHEILFGDDTEYDGAIYSLYSDIISTRLTPLEAITILRKWNVSEHEIELITLYMTELFQKSSQPYKVHKIFIHLETTKRPSYFSTLSPLIIPTYNYFQTAFLLYQDGYITNQGLLSIIDELTTSYHFTLSTLIASTRDLVQRGLISFAIAKKTIAWLKRIEDIHKNQYEIDKDIAMLHIPPKSIKRSIFNFVKRLTSNNFIGNLPNEYKETLLERYLRYTPTRKV